LQIDEFEKAYLVRILKEERTLHNRQLSELWEIPDIEVFDRVRNTPSRL